MLIATVCPYCGKRVPTTALKGICPECMLKAGFATDVGELGPGGTVIHKPPSPAPTIEELAPHFPQLEIIECLGRGGMGVVYKARQPGLDRFVALKILRRSRADGTPDPEFAERFQREARALARLNHPDIVAVYDFGEAGGYNFLLMEHVDGVTLRHLLQTRKLSPEEALAIVPKICGALQFAHDRGIVHRDIKPENILLDKQGQVKIADFGIAKIVGQSAQMSLTHERQIIGTPHYMAPEQVEKPATVDHRADIFSLGVVFYEMLTGELPLGKFQPPSSRMRGIELDVRLDEVVLRALEKEPERRYQHASEVKSDVETISQSPANAGAALPSRAVVNGRSQSERDARLQHLETRRHSMLWYGFLVSLIGFPLAIALRLPYVAMLSIAGGVIGGYKLGLFERGALGRLFRSIRDRFQRDRNPSRSAPAVKNESDLKPDAQQGVAVDHINIVRWLARILGTALLAFYGFFMLVEGLPPIASQPEGVQLNFVALALMLLGFAVGWKRDGTAALLIASGWTLWQVSENRVAWNIFQTPLPIAAFYAYSWWAAQGRKTRTLVSAVTLLAIAFACGRLFLPTNVFVRGTITDTSGAPVPGAELNLIGASGTSLNSNSSPAARAGRDGRFTLYAGWYSPGRNVAITAPGYQTLIASLGPRPMGQRRLVRDFTLQRASQSASVPPVVISTIPASGSTDVDPALTELQVTFSKPMKHAAWDRENHPDLTGSPRLLEGERTYALPVKLKPGTVYAFWFNTENAQPFKDTQGRAAVPYLLIFETRK